MTLALWLMSIAFVFLAQLAGAIEEDRKLRKLWEDAMEAEADRRFREFWGLTEPASLSDPVEAVLA